jgi:hypothetical protein
MVLVTNDSIDGWVIEDVTKGEVKTGDKLFVLRRK